MDNTETNDSSTEETKAPETEAPKTEAPKTEESNATSYKGTTDTGDLDDLTRKLKQANYEAASHRVDLENSRKAWEAEKAKLEAEHTKQLETKDFELKQAAVQTQLAGKVVDVQKAMKLVDDSHFNEDGTLDTDKFLEDNPFLAAKPSVTNPANNPGRSKPVTTADLDGKSAEWIAAHWDDLMPQT